MPPQILQNKDEDDKKQQRIDPSVWDSYVTSKAMCEFNPLSNEVTIVKSHTQSAYDGSDIATQSDGDCYVYHVLADAWTFGAGRFHSGHETGIRHLSNLSHIGADHQLGFIAKKETMTLNLCRLFLWNTSGEDTDNFKIVTGVTDLGDAHSFKSINGIIVTVTESTANSAYTLNLEWRTGPEDSWNALDTIANAATSDSTIGKINHKIVYNPPAIKGITSFQLRISGHVEGDFGINDISIIFRKYRSSVASIFRTGGDT